MRKTLHHLRRVIACVSAKKSRSLPRHYAPRRTVEKPVRESCFLHVYCLAAYGCSRVSQNMTLTATTSTMSRYSNCKLSRISLAGQDAPATNLCRFSSASSILHTQDGALTALFNLTVLEMNHQIWT